MGNVFRLQNEVNFILKPAAKIRDMAQDDYIRKALRVPPDLHRQIHEEAEQRGRSFNAEIIARLQQTMTYDVSGMIATTHVQLRLLGILGAYVRMLTGMLRDAIPEDQQDPSFVFTLENMHRLGGAFEVGDLSNPDDPSRATLVEEYMRHEVEVGKMPPETLNQAGIKPRAEGTKYAPPGPENELLKKVRKTRVLFPEAQRKRTAAASKEPKAKP